MALLTSATSVALVGLGLTSVSEAGIFDAVVPNLSSGWFAKPGPTESLIFGFLVLKVMALRLAGVFPYNLNDLWRNDGIFSETFWKRSSSGRLRRDLYFAKMNNYSKAPFLKEIGAVERILLGLRRIDSHDCFIRHVCQIKQNQLSGQSSAYEDTILKIFSMKPSGRALNGEKTVWDIYHDALTPKVIDCSKKYKMCPLTHKDMQIDNLLSGLF